MKTFTMSHLVSDKRADATVSDTASVNRPASLESHPVIVRNYNCPTLSSDDLAVHVAQWINNGTARGVISAPPGFGKTHSIRYIGEQLAECMPNIIWLKIHCYVFGIDGTPEGSLDPQSLVPVSLEPAARICSDTEHWSLEGCIQELVDRTGQSTIVLWIDDAHLLGNATDDSLRTLQSKLDELGIRLICLLVGQPVVRRLKAFAGSMPVIIPAIRSDEFKLCGFRSATDLEYPLKAFDTKCFPSESDWTYTRFFLPRAYQHNLRLAEYAKMLWEIFVEEDWDSDQQRLTEVPTVCFMKTVEYVLSHSLKHNSAAFTIDQESWRSAVLHSGWIERQQFRRNVRELYGIEDPFEE